MKLNRYIAHAIGFVFAALYVISSVGTAFEASVMNIGDAANVILIFSLVYSLGLIVGYMLALEDCE